MAPLSRIVLLSIAAAAAACSIQTRPIDPNFPNPQLKRVVTESDGFDHATWLDEPDQPAPDSQPKTVVVNAAATRHGPAATPRDGTAPSKRASFSLRRAWRTRLSGFEDVMVRQEDPDWCWAACAQMLLAFDGRRTMQPSIVREVLGDEREVQTASKFEILQALSPDLRRTVTRAVAEGILDSAIESAFEGEGELGLGVDADAVMTLVERELRQDPLPSALYDLVHGYPSVIGLTREDDAGHVYVLVGARYSVPARFVFFFSEDVRGALKAFAEDEDRPDWLQEWCSKALRTMDDEEYGPYLEALVAQLAKEITERQYRPLSLELYDPFTGRIEVRDAASLRGRVGFAASRPAAQRFYEALEGLIQLHRESTGKRS